VPMLPFLKPRQVGSIVFAKRKPDGSHKTESVEGEQHPKLMEAAEKLISAVHQKDAKLVAEALQAAFNINEELEDKSEDSE